MLDRLTANLQFHGQALALRAERQQALASNIANADTPNYKARELDFSQALRNAVGAAPGRLVPTPAGAAGASGASSGAPAAGQGTSAPGHLPLRAVGGSVLRSSGDADLLWRVPEQPSIDGNTVDLDRERASFADNSLRYEATLRFINGSVRNMLSAIRGE
jgi:flagellar basal-body rod protein FlgB